MTKADNPTWRLLSRLLAVVSLLLLTGQLSANVFGDGDPDNGDEDERSRLEAAGGYPGNVPAWPMSAGTLFCDGKLRGTAMLVDPGQHQPPVTGLFLVTAAHVLFDLETATPFAQCSFHFMGLGGLDGYHVRLEPEWIRSGAFEPASDPGNPLFGADDWAFAWLPEAWPYAGRVGAVPLMSLEQLRMLPSGDAQFDLVAWDQQQGRMSLSGACQVVESGPEDLGGGAWAGQLLDDCDSADGASGGGLMAVTRSGRYLVGIRTGSHWSPAAYPDGPIPGSAWDIRHNTNFARAIDAELLSAFADLLDEVRSALAR